MSTAVLTPAMVGVASVGDSRSQRKDGVPLGKIRKELELVTASMRMFPAAKDFDSITRTLLSNARSDGGATS